MKKTNLLLALFCAASLFVGCNDDDGSNSNNNPPASDFEQNFGSSVSRDFIGQIVDMGNNPIQGATVRIGSETVQSDANGMFVANGVSVKEKFAYVTATKMGYFQGSRSLVPISGKNNVKIMMIPNAPIATVESGSTSEVTTDSGTKITFDGSFEDENGNPYSGSVSVSAFHLKPSDENISALMPGMLYAERENGNQAALQTFGMINVELRGSGGQILQPAEGHPAGIEVAIDNAQAASAPSTIELWHFDAAKGWWKEDGIATRQGNKYVGEASHFSWWNCDAPFPTAQLTVTVNDEDGNPIANAGVGISFGGMTWPYIGITSGNGQVSGLVPANETLNIEVYNICGEVVYSTTQAPISSATSITVTASSGSAQSVLIEGTLQNCDGDNVTEGYVLLNYGSNHSFAAVSNGSFSFSVLTCGAALSFTLQGGDYGSLQQTGSINYSFTVPVTNVGNLQACAGISEFISYTVDDDPAVFLIQNLNASVGIQGQSTNGITISGWDQDGGATNGTGLFIYSPTVNTVGSYTTAQFSLEGTLGYIYSATTNDIVFNLTNVGAVGEYIDLNFSGTFVGQDGNTHTITGLVHAIRDN